MNIIIRSVQYVVFVDQMNCQHEKENLLYTICKSNMQRIHNSARAYRVHVDVHNLLQHDFRANRVQTNFFRAGYIRVVKSLWNYDIISTI